MTLLSAPGSSFAAVVLASLCVVASAAGIERMPEENRPRFHFTPQKNWMNDPNGLVFYQGEWHLFHQYNPRGDTWGHMSWGHAVSRDLLRWEHLPVALHEEDGVMIFSGSAVFDEQNTSGFGTKDNPPLVAIYTGHGHEKQTQNLAFSTDRGRTWRKFSGNPVLDENLKDFRDPKVFWHEPSGAWVMVVALSDQKKVRFYSSPDLKKWKPLGEFGGQGATDGAWECPDFFALPVGGRTRWVLTVGVSGGAPAGGNGTQYFVGDFDGTTFKNENAAELKLWADHGPDFYAAQSWSNVPPSDGRRIFIGWMTNFRYAPQEPTSPWRGTQSLPRELSLVETKNGPRLAQSRVRELLKLRGEEVHPGDAIGVGPPLELERTVERTSSTSFTLSSASDEPASAVTVGYDAAKREVYVDRRHARPGKSFHPEFAARYAAPVITNSDRPIALRVFVDRTSVEVFGDDGLSVLTVNTFADPPLKRLDAPNVAPVTKIWRLKSTWNDKE